MRSFIKLFRVSIAGEEELPKSDNASLNLGMMNLSQGKQRLDPKSI